MVCNLLKMKERVNEVDILFYFTRINSFQITITINSDFLSDLDYKLLLEKCLTFASAGWEFPANKTIPVFPRESMFHSENNINNINNTLNYPDVRCLKKKGGGVYHADCSCMDRAGVMDCRLALALGAH